MASEAPRLVPPVAPELVVEPLHGDWAVPDTLALPASRTPGPDDGRSRDRARRAYADLARGARHDMDAFLAATDRVTERMADAYAGATAEIVRGHDRDQERIDQVAARTVGEIDDAAAAAEAALEQATGAARRGVDTAGRRAFALVAGNDRAAARRIPEIVVELVSGHVAAFDGAVTRVRQASATTLDGLEAWKAAAATRHPTDLDPMTSAQNEVRQTRIPVWAEREATQIRCRVRQRTAEWAAAGETTVCGLRCSYRTAIDAERTRLAAAGRTSVRTALTAAHRALAEQARAGTRTILQLRTGRTQQVRTQAAATRTARHARAREALRGAHHEVVGAVGGVQGAARGGLPTYWRSVTTVGEELAGAAPRGAQALQAATDRAPAVARSALQRTGAQLKDRLDANLVRLRSALAQQGGLRDEQASAQMAQWDAAAAGLVDHARQGLAENTATVQAALDSLPELVTSASAESEQTLVGQMAAFVAGRRADAQAALTRQLTGEQPQAPVAGGAPVPAATGKTDTCADCRGADTPPGPVCPPSPASAATPAPASGPSPATKLTARGGGVAAAPGLTAQVDEEIAYLDARARPEEFFRTDLDAVEPQVVDELAKRAVDVSAKFSGGFLGTVDEEGVIATLRGLTRHKGHALDVVSYPALTDAPSLDSHLRHYLDEDSDDYAAADAYLRGDTVEGARRELADALGTFNDDEARIEAALRALSPDQLKALGRDSALVEKVRDALDGTDRQVFDALVDKQDHALADAHRLRDAVNRGRLEQDPDAVHSAIERYTGAPDEGDWRATQEIPSETRRAAVVAALGRIVPDDEVARGADGRDVATMTAQDRAVAYVNREVPVLVGVGEFAQVEMRALTGANRDLSTALLLQGAQSVEARAARLGVEAQRTGDDPRTVNIDRALHDERFAPDRPGASPEERAENAQRRSAARDDRARVLLLAARYAPPAGTVPVASAPLDRSTTTRSGFAREDAEVDAARQALIARFRGRYGDDELGGRVVAGLLTDERPTPQTASLVMQHAMYSHLGTDEALLFQFTERMTRSESAAMAAQFQRDTGRSLEAELGVYGEGGTFTELSGDDRLRMERALRGVPQNDRERLENAAFALAQQRRETGAFGSWLAEGTLAEHVLINTERALERMAGGPIPLSRRGDLLVTLDNFDPEKGGYTGEDRAEFLAVTGVAQTVAENYAKRIDAFADILTTGIAIVGAIAAAAITVATGGAAAPLVAAAIATGLASMAASYAIKGGRYGWEQAAVDLGMTAVQAITAGVGAQLGAAAQVASKGAQAAGVASRSLATLARLFTGNPVVDQIIIGTLTGSIGGLANVAFDERTWERSGGDAVGALFSGLFKGALSGGATAALTSSIEALGRNGAAISARAREIAAKGGLVRGAVGVAGRGVGGLGRGVSAALGASTGGGALATARAVASRGLVRGTISGLGGMAGRATELAYDAATGRFRGDAGDAALDIGRAGAHSFVQAVGEGAAETVGQGVHDRRLAAAAAAVNRARVERGLPPLHGDPLHEGSPLRTAAEDLLFLDVHGRGTGDRQGNLAHVAAHGGFGPALATIRPPVIVEDAMRAELVRHVPPELHGALADTPIRVLPEAEYRALTRSESGPVVTLVQDGRAVVVVREGTPITRLADEGPHLVQLRDSRLRARAATLDEATLARWDALDLDTQLELYRTKIDLEIDAHERIHDSIDAELRSGPGTDPDRQRLADDLERNAATLRNLRARGEEVARIGPEQRAAIAAGEQERPQYLEQPARLFTKDEKITPAAGEHEPPAAVPEPPERLRGASAEPGRKGRVEVALHPPAADPEVVRGRVRGMPPGEQAEMYAEAVRSAAGRNPATAAALPGPFIEDNLYTGARQTRAVEGLTRAGILAERPGGRIEVADAGRYLAWLERAYQMRGGAPLEPRVRAAIERYVRGGALQPRGVDPATGRISGAGSLPGTHAEILAVNRALAAGGHPVDVATVVSKSGDHFIACMHCAAILRNLGPDVRVATGAARPVAGATAEAAPDGSVRIVWHARPEPEVVRRPDPGVGRASAGTPEAHADAMREALLRHVPQDQHEALSGVRIDVLPADEYRALTQSERGPVVTLVVGDEPRVVVRDGTPIYRLSDEGPHLSQAIEAPTRAAVARHDEAVMARWHELDLDTQIDLYRNKIALEIDAHERVARSLAAETPLTEADRARRAAEIDRTETVLRNLRARRVEVEALDPAKRAAILDGTRNRPDYLDQPARLFSKDPRDPPPGPPLTDEERQRLRAGRGERKRAEAAARQADAPARQERARQVAEHQQRAQAQEEARSRRQSAVDEEVAARARAVEEGLVSPAEDRRARLAAAAGELDLDLARLAAAIIEFREELGGGGRRYTAQEVVDSLRDRTREERPPRYGDLEGLVSKIIVEQNAAAVTMMREHIARVQPDVVLGVDRGGAFLAEVLSTGVAGFPETKPVPKSVEKRPGRPDLVRRRPKLEAEIRERIGKGQKRFAIVDFYMGGGFAGELRTMAATIRRDHPDVEFEILWMRETIGFEEVVVMRPERTDSAARRARRRALEEGGVSFTGVAGFVKGRFRIRRPSAGIAVRPLRGETTDPKVRIKEFPVDVVLGDDIDAVFDRLSTAPVEVFDRAGRVERVIPVGTPDPETGRPLRTVREIWVRLAQGAFDDNETERSSR